MHRGLATGLRALFVLTTSANYRSDSARSSNFELNRMCEAEALIRDNFDV